MNCGFSLAHQSKSDRAEGYKLNRVLDQSGDYRDPRHERLAAAAPAALAAKIRDADELAGERRVVTALFADVVGSTALAESMDPEDWTQVMNNAFDRLVPVIYRYEGTIARLMGDALLVFFGAPVAHEDDPVRAILAGLDLISMTESYAAEMRQQFGIDFAVRVGINTGPVVVGAVGSDLVYEYTAMGDAVNLAARMQAAARPMTVLVTEYSHRFVEPVFDFEDLGTIQVKGKSDPVHAYVVVRMKKNPGRMRGLAGLDSPMVGRESELKVLLEASDATIAGLGRIAVIIGEAGLGKSRLVEEWKRAVHMRDGRKQLPVLAADQTISKKSQDPTSFRWIEGHCLSYGQSLAYHLLLDLLRSILDVPGSASEGETRSALDSLTQDLFGEDATNIYPYLGHLLSLTLDAESLERIKMLDPQALQMQYLYAFRQLLQALMKQCPLILILEDIHWADSSSVQLLLKLFPIVLEAPLLICMVSRPDRDSAGSKLIATARELMGAGLIEIDLHTLSPADSNELVHNLLAIDALSDNVRNIILKKAEGNPFFVEEVIRMLIDREIIVHTESGWISQRDIDTMDIPDNLQRLLLARIDRLPEEVKRTLRVASVIGRQFSAKVLEQVLENLNGNE